MGGKMLIELREFSRIQKPAARRPVATAKTVPLRGAVVHPPQRLGYDLREQLQRLGAGNGLRPEDDPAAGRAAWDALMRRGERVSP